mmetsp:Transcript_14160/g.30960  ORF Transcript_14160/g.30960 Transcript_14160/m.30960 type:complete len:407 (+) Transcript_14160:631-1851(+)
MITGTIGNSKGDCYFPQVEALNEIHAEYPKATFILNTRDTSAWYNSVANHSMMNDRLALCNITGFPPTRRARKEDFIELYEAQISRIKSFVQTYPSHKLVEIQIDSDDSAQTMVDAFGGDINCWKQANTREDVRQKQIELQQRRRQKYAFQNSFTFENDQSLAGMKNITTMQGLIDYYRKQQEKENGDVTYLSEISVDEQLHSPTLVMGLPRMGTASLREFFSCIGLKTSNQFCSGHGGLRNLSTCSQIIQSNVMRGLPAFHETGDYEVYTQMGLEYISSAAEDSHDFCYFPQIEALEEIHAQYPDATFVLNTRNVFKWLESVNGHMDLAKRLALCNITGYLQTDVTSPSDLLLLYSLHEKRIKDFVEQNPSHRLVEIDIDSPDAGKVLVQKFGGDASCWGQKNTS